MKLVAVGIFVCTISTMLGCGNGSSPTESNPTVLDNSYTGTLHLSFSNTFPEFSETASVTAEVDRYGNMTFGTGTLNYSGEDDNISSLWNSGLAFDFSEITLGAVCEMTTSQGSVVWTLTLSPDIVP